MLIITLNHVRNKYRHLAGPRMERQYLTYAAYKQMSCHKGELVWRTPATTVDAPLAIPAVHV